MEVDKLKKDELLFEIGIRGVVLDSSVTVEDLRSKLKSQMDAEEEVDLEDVFPGTQMRKN